MKKKLICLLICFLVIISGAVFYRTRNVKKSYVTINSILDKIYTYTDGYDRNMGRIVSEEVFSKVNISKSYKVPIFKQPISLKLKINEFNQHKIDDKVFVYFEYDLVVYDGDNKEIAGSWRSPTVATVIEKDGRLYIENIQEYETSNDVPKLYK